MSNLDRLLTTLGAEHIAQHVAIAHDEARQRYRLSCNTVGGTREFERAIADYYAYHYCACVAPGATLARAHALSKAKRILESAYRRRGYSLNNALDDACKGTNGGLAGVLSILADALRDDTVRDYIDAQLDQAVDFDSWSEKKDMMRQLLQYYPRRSASDNPEQYAHNWKEFLIKVKDRIDEMNRELRSM
jgi:hypothetical protein